MGSFLISLCNSFFLHLSAILDVILLIVKFYSMFLATISLCKMLWPYSNSQQIVRPLIINIQYMSFNIVLSNLCTGQLLASRLRNRADRKRYLAREPEVRIRDVPRFPDLHYEPPAKMHKPEDKWLNEIGTLLFIDYRSDRTFTLIKQPD